MKKGNKGETEQSSEIPTASVQGGNPLVPRGSRQGDIGSPKYGPGASRYTGPLPGESPFDCLERLLPDPLG